MKKVFLGFITLVLLISLAACSTGDKDEGKEEKKEEEKPKETALYDNIKESGVLNVGTEGTYAPFTFHNEQDELTGYDVEVIKEVAKRMDLEVEFMETQWDSMFAGLNSERFHLIANFAHHLPFQTGSRFSEKARAPSLRSSERFTFSTAAQASCTANASFSETFSVIFRTCLIAG